ncbi:MAG: HAMP domain-containing histidine kinase [Clostridiales bacterium]|nr:HAMP domain-containing histidine kinase [Clostridiales bacterium]
MKRSKKIRRKRSLGRYIFSALIALTIIMLVILWVFQVMLLEPFYRVMKNYDIRAACETIEKNLNSDNLVKLLDHYALNRSIDVRIFSQTENEVISTAYNAESYVHSLSAGSINAIYRRAKQTGGVLADTVINESIQLKLNPSRTRLHSTITSTSVKTENLLYAKVVTMPGGSDRMILLSSRVTPVSSTVDTLKVQLICITAITIILSLILAIIISRRISKPIVKTNESAKQLAEGNFDISFEQGKYREVAELAETLNFAAKELSKTEGLRREIISNISHELRTPITMIAGYAEMMRDLPGESTPENLQIIIDEANRLTALVGDILDLSSYQAGTQILSPEHMSLTELLSDITTRYSKLTEQDGYSITFSCAEDIHVYADKLKLSQVVYNLIGNAVNYSPDDRRVEIFQRRIDDCVRVEVTDHGPGIPPDKIRYIWDRFYKVDTTKRAKINGTGLGLSIAKNILILHNARYGVETDQNAGSTFWFELPIEKE